MPKRRSREWLPVSTPRLDRDGLPTLREGLTPEARRLLAQSVSPNTLRGMRSDLRVYRKAGGRLPATDIEIANFLSRQNAVGKSPATLERYANSLHMWHRYMNYPSPVRTMAVRSVLRGIKRTRDMRQKAAPALRLSDLFQLLSVLDRSTLKGLQDSALFTLCFYGAFRRSEVVAIAVEDLDWQPQGVVITIHHSKTNQSGRIETKSIMRAPPDHSFCPVRLVEAWLQASGIWRGAVFRAISRADRINAGRMTSTTLYNRMKTALQAAGLADKGFTPHSFRAGFITEAHLRGKSDVQIKRVSGHRDQRTFEKYIRIADAFENHGGDFFGL